jgi:hypothetical protein
MNNGDTVAKKDFTASFNSSKRRGFWMIYNKNLARNESKCIDVFGHVLLWTMREIFSQKDGITPNFIKNRSLKSKEIWTWKQVSRYNIFKGIF